MWKQPQCPLIDEWVNKMWYVKEYYAALKKEEILTYATWINLEDIV